MRLNTANRSFLWLLVAGIALHVAAAAGACVLLSLLLIGLASEGFAAFGTTPWVILPAGIFLGLLGASGVFGIRSLGAQVAASRRLARRIDGLTRPSPGRLAAAGHAARLDDRLRLVEERGCFSFTYGAIRPCVVVSRTLFDSVSSDELEAVLVHERYHVGNLDPLKVVLARALARGFFFLPALRELEGRYVAGRELAADRRALRRCGHRPLASALLKVVRGPEWPELVTAAAIGGPELLDVRVAQLESREEPRLGGVSRRALLATAVGLGLVALSFAVSVGELGGLGAATALSDARMESAGLGLVMVAGCATPLLVFGWLAWRWLRA